MNKAFSLSSPLLSEEFLAPYKTKFVPWGFGDLSWLVAKRTYMRIKDDGTTEEWWETLRRVVEGAQKIGAQYTKEEAEQFYDLMFHLKCLLSGRMLWQLGTSTVDRFGGNSLLSCWFVNINTIESFCFLFENLMLGGGVGFSVKREHVHDFPKVKKGVKIIPQKTNDADFIVPDSRQGWVSLLRKVLNAFFYTGESFTYSTILVRGAGAPIKGFGGKASGPEILEQGISWICEVLAKRENKKIRSIDALDICNIIAYIVVSGNTRRSAELSLGDPDDYLFMKAKRWDIGNIPNWRAMSNNSLYVDSYDHIMPLVWEGYNGNGEPYGFVNIELAKKYGRLIDEPMSSSEIYPFKEDNCEGFNPCVTGDTLIYIPNEPFLVPIKTLAESGKDVLVNCFDNNKNIVQRIMHNPRKTGDNVPVFKIGLSDGTRIRATGNHKFLTTNVNREDPPEYKELRELSPGDWISEVFQGKIVRRIACQIVFICSAGYQDVYNGTVDDFHNYLIGRRTYDNFSQSKGISCVVSRNCGEIALASFENCNLSELFLNNIASQEEMISCAKLLYKTQKAICALPFLHKETEKIVHQNFRIGIGITGICQSLEKLEWLDPCYKALRTFDIEWSKKRNWPRSIKLTTTKPSGSLSLLGGATSGIHPGFAQYYIRRVRMAADDTLVSICRDLGYKVEHVLNFDGSKDFRTVTVEFPCRFDNTILAKDMTAVQQLELVKRIQTYWSDNAISVTVYYRQEEFSEIQTWLKENYQPNIKSVRFLLHKDHNFVQPPLEEIDQQTYEKMVGSIKSRKTIEIEKDMGGELSESIECEKGVCPVR